MRIGLDTLFENPARPTNAMSYLVGLVRNLSRLSPTDEYFAFVSRANAHLFAETGASNVQLTWAGSSNERVTVRILSQQVLEPLLAQRLGLDVFHSPGNVLPLLTRTPTVLKICSLHHYKFADTFGVLRTAYRTLSFALSARKADLIIANSRSNYDDILTYLNVNPERVAIIPEALDELFVGDSTQAETAAVLSRYGVGNPFILFASSLWRYKNAHGLIEGFRLLVDRYPVRHDLVIAGSVVISGRAPAAYADELVRLPFRLGLADRVRFLGHVPQSDLRHLYAACAVFVYPSLYETFGHPPLQAMARGAPVVASNASSVPEVVGSGALLVSPTSPEEIAEGIWRVLSDDNLRRKLIQEGYATAAKYTWQRTAEMTRQAFARVVRN